jgi:ADP-ribose pyrophosphatase YjhB (NUDIX family)
LRELKKIADNVLLLVEYKDAAPSASHPLTSDHRENLLQHLLLYPNNDLPNVHIRGLKHHPYNTFKVSKCVFEHISDVSNENGEWFNLADCFLYTPNTVNNHLYREIGLEFITKDIPYDINPTANTWYINDIVLHHNLIPRYITTILNTCLQTDPALYERLRHEYDVIQKYKKAAAVAPYPPTYVTVDAVIIQANHILLIQRKSAPGQDLWALPGGFLNQEETIIDGMIRELVEETKIKVPPKVLKGSIVKQQVFDDPNRSARGRTITHACLIHLSGTSSTLPKVKGQDDAKTAAWVPLQVVLNDMKASLFEDHLSIIETLTTISK